MPANNIPTKVIYVAGPYRGDVDGNITRAGKMAMRLWEHGFIALCPHLNSAHFGSCCQAPESVFLDGYLELLKRCDGVMALEGWVFSTGSKAEISLAKKLGIPIFYEYTFESLLDYSWEVILPLTLRGDRDNE